MDKISATKIKLAADKIFMKKIFGRRVNKYFPGAKISSFAIKLERNSFNVNFLFTYTFNLVKNSKKFKKNIKGKSVTESGNPSDCSKRAFTVSKYLWDHGFKNKIPRPLDYFPSLHLFIYEEVFGESLENKICKKEKKPILNYAPKIAKLLKKIHQSKIKINLLKDRSFEKKQNLHFLNLFKKFNPLNYNKFKKNLEEIEKLRDQNGKFFLSSQKFCLAHGDFHPGNVIINQKKIKFIDFGSAGLADPLSDVGNFLMQAELMLRLQFYPNHLSTTNKLRSIFLKNYFNRPIRFSSKLRLLYYEIRCLIQTMAVMSLAQHKKPKLQEKSISSFFEILENRLTLFRNLSKNL